MPASIWNLLPELSRFCQKRSRAGCIGERIATSGKALLAMTKETFSLPCHSEGADATEESVPLCSKGECGFFANAQNDRKIPSVRFYTEGRKLFAQVCVDGGSALLARAHCQNDSGSAGDRITAGEHAVTGGHLVFVDDQTALLVGLQTGGGGPD